MFAVKFKCKEAKSSDGHVMTKEGEECWLLPEPEGWVPATSYKADSYKEIPKDVKVFDKETEALKFMKSWKGHPWYNVPNGDFEVIKVEKKFKMVFDGYKVDEGK